MKQENAVTSNDLITRIGRISRLLKSVADLECKLLEETRSFLLNKELCKCLANQKAEHKRKADRFDLFQALRLERREIYHSRFIAYLLDPSAYHDQGLVFLNSFLSGLKEDSVVNEKTVWVYTELSFPHGRIDIVLETPQLCIAIENKIDADEEDKQIERYREWLNDRPQKTKKLVFLTPKGHEPRTGKADILMSYAQLAGYIEKALEHISKDATKLHIIVGQYAQSCRALTLGDSAMSRMNKEMYELLTQENNIEIALEIHQQIELVKQVESEDFKQRIWVILQTKINDEPNLKIVESGILGVAIQVGANGLFCGLGKFDLSGKEGSQGWLGWVAPESENQRIKAEAARLNLKKDNQSPMFKTFSLPLLDIIIDKRDENHVLANRLADELWNFFCETRKHF